MLIAEATARTRTNPMNIPSRPSRALAVLALTLVVTLTAAFSGQRGDRQERPERYHTFLSEPIRRLTESTRRDYVEIDHIAGMLNDLEERGHEITDILPVSEGFPADIGGGSVPRVLVVTRR